jgi:glycerol-3-phosphate dehydrogenase
VSTERDQYGKRDLVILGGGAGGLVVASVASQLGLRVTLIESWKVEDVQHQRRSDMKKLSPTDRIPTLALP